MFSPIFNLAPRPPVAGCRASAASHSSRRGIWARQVISLGLQERPGSFYRQTISIGVYRLGDKIEVKGPCALAVAGSLGRLRGSVEAPEAAGLISEVRFESLQRLPRSITLQQHLSKQLARRDDGTGNDWISFDGILAVGGRPQRLQCFFLPALRIGDPGGYHLAMDIDLRQPIVFEDVAFR